MIQLPLETWKDISGFEHMYQVSSLGRIKSLSRTVAVRGGYRTTTEKLLNCSHLPNGYVQVHLSKNHHVSMKLLHRLVAEAFIPNPDNFPCINHKDGDPSNNCVDNIEWCTYEYNSNYPICKQRQSLAMHRRYAKDPDFLMACKQRLDRYHAQSRRRVCQLTQDGVLVNTWESALSTASAGFKHTNVISCANGKRKTHHGYKWMWADIYERG